ncbi:MAG: DUF3048 domain-containing protein [Patescibacteria group bacterium]|jgi:hypothetical protein
MNEKIKKVKELLLKTNKHWQKYWWQYTLGVFFLCLLLIAYAFRVMWLPEKSPEQVVENLLFRHPLTGEKTEGETVRPQVFGVMVENSADAWPLSGVEDAFLVIEAPVEANIPRLITFFYDGQTAEKIGPVRSARPYYLDWAAELDALYAHCGGSPAALELLSAGDLLDLNEFWNGKYFWRSPSRYAPHNVYTSTELLTSAAVSTTATREIYAPTYSLWNFKDDSPVETPADSDLIIENGLTYKTEWRYDATTNNYIRWQSGAEVKSEDGDSILADNVAVVYTPVSVVDSIGRLELETVGQGEAVIVQDGRKINAVWKKESADERLRFYAEDGKEIGWNTGKTWIEVVSTVASGR